MNLIKPKFEILEQQSGIDGIYKMIELAGRTCYRSEDKITEDSAKAFVDRMIASGHGAMLEHGTVYLKVPYSDHKCAFPFENGYYDDCIGNYRHNKYSKVIQVWEDDNTAYDYVTTNLRVLVENDWLMDLQYICEPTEHHEKRVTVRFTCDRGVSHEFVRHRVFSFAQESTRYCNYSKDKFNNEITFIYPCWFNQYFEDNYSNLDISNWQIGLDISDSETNWLYAMLYSEKAYFSSISNGMKPQQARAVLPNSLKTELVMTGFVSDWWGKTNIIKGSSLVKSISNGSPNLEAEVSKYDSSYKVVRNGFFGLRCTPAAHPQAQELAIPLREEFIRRNYLN